MLLRLLRNVFPGNDTEKVLVTFNADENAPVCRVQGMGFEYVVRCDLPADYDLEEFVSKLDNPVDSRGWPAFNVSIQSDGFYFCDNGRSDQSAVAFRNIVDEALLRSGKVIVEEP